MIKFIIIDYKITFWTSTLGKGKIFPLQNDATKVVLNPFLPEYTIWQFWHFNYEAYEG